MEDYKVVVLRVNGKIIWFRSEPELWVLDYQKWVSMFTDYGYVVPDKSNNIRDVFPVITKSNILDYMPHVAHGKISVDVLRKEFVELIEKSSDWWDVAHLFPVMLIDFDSQNLFVLDDDTIPYSKLVPDGWVASSEDFISSYDEKIFPLSSRFWVIKNVDMFSAIYVNRTT